MSTVLPVAPAQLRSTIRRFPTLEPVAVSVMVAGVEVGVAVAVAVAVAVGVNVAVGVALGTIVAVAVAVAVAVGLGVGLFPRQTFTFVVWPLVIEKFPVCVPTPVLETE